MKTLLLAGMGLGLLSLAPQSKAGVTIDLRFGSDNHHHARSRVEVCEPPRRVVYHRPVYVAPRRVVIVQQPECAPARAPVCDNYFSIGHDWARDLRDCAATRDQFVVFLRSHLVRASSGDYRDFRRGFIEGYGIHGERAFEKAFEQARNC